VAATERLIVPLSPTDKRRIEKRARRHAMSMAEYARRAMIDYDPDSDRAAAEAELRALIETHEAAFRSMVEQIDRADAAFDRMVAHFAAKEESA
jgi:phosphate uptake regulator